MITEPTVFILGAGASVPYGFPTGAQLRTKICKNFTNKYAELFSNHGSTPTSFVDEKRFDSSKFTNAFYLSGNASIDLFLSRRCEFSELGKMAIVMEILDAESKSNFYEDSPEGQDWYSYLFGRMSERIKASQNWTTITENKMHFITFNYDRSLEYSLYRFLANSFDFKNDWAMLDEVFKKIPIYHIYGQIGKLTWQLEYEGKKHYNLLDPNYLGYGRDCNYSIISKSINNILTIHEERQTLEMETIRNLISKAQRIFFLGFGFAPENMEVLGIPSSIRGDAEVFGTCYGLKNGEMRRIKNMFDGGIVNGKKIGADMNRIILSDSNCLDLLREYL